MIGHIYAISWLSIDVFFNFSHNSTPISPTEFSLRQKRDTSSSFSLTVSHSNPRVVSGSFRGLKFFRLSWETSTFKNYHPEGSPGVIVKTEYATTMCLFWVLRRALPFCTLLEPHVFDVIRSDLIYKRFSRFIRRDFEPQKLLLRGGFKIQLVVKMSYPWVLHFDKKLHFEAPNK